MLHFLDIRWVGDIRGSYESVNTFSSHYGFFLVSPQAESDVEVGDATEEVVTGMDLSFIDCLESLEAEGFDVEAGKDAALDDCFFQEIEDHVVAVEVRSEVAREAARKCVTGTGWVVNVLQWVGWATKECTIWAEEQAAVLPFLDRNVVGAHVADGAPGFDEAGFAGKLACLAVVQDQHVDAGYEASEGGLGDIDPKIHGISNHEAGLVDLIEDVVLQIGGDICQQDDAWIFVAFGEIGGEVFENIQGHRTGLPGVHVPHVFAGPAECLPGNSLETFEIDTTLAEEIDVFTGKVLANDANEVHWAEIGGRDSSVGSGATEQVLMLGELGFDVIERDRAND